MRGTCTQCLRFRTSKRQTTRTETPFNLHCRGRRAKDVCASVCVIIHHPCELDFFSSSPWLYDPCLYGTLPSFSCMICSLRRHRFSPNSSSRACFDGSVTLRSGTILIIGFQESARRFMRKELIHAERELTYCPWIPSFTMSSLVAANSAGLHPSSTGSFIIGFMAVTPTFPMVPYASTACSS